MSAYIYGLICASLAIGVAELLIPEGAKTAPYLKLICGLVLLVAIVKPLGQLADFIPDFGERIFEHEYEDDGYEGVAEEKLAEAYEKGIETALAENFSLKDFEVGVVMGDDKKPQRVAVTLTGRDIFRDPYKIEAFIKTAFGCECVTLIG